MVPNNDHDVNNDDTSLQYNHDLHIIPLILFTNKISEKKANPHIRPYKKYAIFVYIQTASI